MGQRSVRIEAKVDGASGVCTRTMAEVSWKVLTLSDMTSDENTAPPADSFRATVTKESIDLGIVVRNGEAMLRFYRDVLGLDHFQSNPMPLGMAGTMHRIRCGTSVLKLVDLETKSEASNPPGGLGGGTGFRYLTFFVDDLDIVLARVADAGHKITIKRTNVRPGVDISMVVDPDGNWVEIGQTSEA